MNVNEFYNNNFDESTRLSGNDNRHKVELYRKRFLYKYTIEHVRPKKIIQIACGTGVHTNWLCENYPDIEIYASDIIPKHVEQLNDYPNLHKRVWDCTDKLPEEYESRDTHSVEHYQWLCTNHQ
jgi:trans-aconitate methyltransferase